MAFTVTPITGNTITQGTDSATQFSLSDVRQSISRNSFSSGFTPTGSGASLVINIASGIAYVNGWRVSESGAAPSVAASLTNNLLYLRVSAGAASYVVLTGDSVAKTDLLICQFTSAAASTTIGADLRRIDTPSLDQVQFDTIPTGYRSPITVGKAGAGPIVSIGLNSTIIPSSTTAAVLPTFPVIDATGTGTSTNLTFRYAGNNIFAYGSAGPFPSADNATTLGLSTNRWSTSWTVVVNSGASDLTLTPNAAVIPTSDNTKSLGTTALRWSDLNAAKIPRSGHWNRTYLDVQALMADGSTVSNAGTGSTLFGLTTVMSTGNTASSISTLTTSGAMSLLETDHEVYVSLEPTAENVVTLGTTFFSATVASGGIGAGGTAQHYSIILQGNGTNWDLVLESADGTTVSKSAVIVGGIAAVTRVRVRVVGRPGALDVFAVAGTGALPTTVSLTKTTNLPTVNPSQINFQINNGATAATNTVWIGDCYLEAALA